MPAACRPPRSHRSALCACVVGVVVLVAVLAGASTTLIAATARPLPHGREDSLFNFIRARYSSSGGWGEAYYSYEGRLWQRWETDFPQADANFLFRLTELSAVRVNPTPRAVDLDLTELARFPFLYLCDVGWMELAPQELADIREYLGRGGFMWIDDFWGEAEWRNFESLMERVLPGTPWHELASGHALFEVLYPLPEGLPQVPARDFFEWGLTHDAPQAHRQPAWGVERPHARAWFDDRGRLSALATFNTDLGDGFEREAWGQEYFERFSSVAYAMGTNIVLYNLTH